MRVKIEMEFSLTNIQENSSGVTRGYEEALRQRIVDQLHDQRITFVHPAMQKEVSAKIDTCLHTFNICVREP